MIQKFKVGICTFSYGGNGGISSEVPDIREWAVPLVAEVAKDDRISDVRMWNLADTPITMTRNRAVLQAREHGIDILVMVDSDMKPDMYVGSDPLAKPFFQSSLDFIINHYHKGPVVVGVPYCGPPPSECVYVFRWNNQQTGHPNPDFQLEMYDRHTAVKMAGIQECAALPTGLIMYDMRCFELTEPKKPGDHPWFYYEWTDIYASAKASTEDVTNTRDLSLVGTQKLGYNPVFCNWDAWAGHWKPKCVGKPAFIEPSGVCAKLKESWEAGYDGSTKLIDLQPSPAFANKIASCQSGPIAAKPGVAGQWEPDPFPGFDGMGMKLPLEDANTLRWLTQMASGYSGSAIIEVGSWAGRSAIVMASRIKELGLALNGVICVDHWEGNKNDNGCAAVTCPDKAWNTFWRNTYGYDITSIRDRSLAVAERYKDYGPAMVYLDAEHDYESVKADIAAWLKSRPSIIAGHDYLMPGVRLAVDEAFHDGHCSKGNVWWKVLE